jgi:hypothetical protein
MFDATFPDDWYGPGTEKIRRILGEIQSIKWFFQPQRKDVDLLGTTVDRHLALLRDFDRFCNIPITFSLVCIAGDWRLLHQDRWGEDPYNPWGDRWSIPDKSIARIGHQLSRLVMTDLEVRRLVRPPLWPVANRCDINGFPLVAQQDILHQLPNLKIGSRDWAVAWNLLCRAEQHIRSALLWELAAGANVIHCANPFLSLLDLYQYGGFPMGWTHDEYNIYYPSI